MSLNLQRMGGQVYLKGNLCYSVFPQTFKRHFKQSANYYLTIFARRLISCRQSVLRHPKVFLVFCAKSIRINTELCRYKLNQSIWGRESKVSSYYMLNCLTQDVHYLPTLKQASASGHGLCQVAYYIPFHLTFPCLVLRHSSTHHIWKHVIEDRFSMHTLPSLDLHNK